MVPGLKEHSIPVLQDRSHTAFALTLHANRLIKYPEILVPISSNIEVGDAVLLCVHAGRREPREKKHGKKKGGGTTPRSTTRRLDRKGRVARATRRPQETRTAWEAAKE